MVPDNQPMELRELQQDGSQAHASFNLLESPGKWQGVAIQFPRRWEEGCSLLELR